MVLGDTVKRPGFFRRNLIYFPLVAGMFAFSGCGRDDSSPVSPSNGGNGGGSDTTGYVEDNGTTNNNGKVKIGVDGKKFDVYVKNEGGNALSDIGVKGDNYEDDVFIFLASDLQGDYYANRERVDLSPNRISSGSINDVLISLRRGNDEVEVRDTEIYDYDFENNPRLEFMGIVPVSFLRDIYREEDALVRNTILLEFMANVTGSYEFQLASKLNNGRNGFLNKMSTANKWLDKITYRLSGHRFQEEAYYLDVYRHKFLNILTHKENEDRLCTLKGKVRDQSSGDFIEDVEIRLTDGHSSYFAYTNSQGDYTFYYVNEGGHLLITDVEDYVSRTIRRDVLFSQPPFYEVNLLNFYLTPETTTTLDTLILRPGSEGKDAYVSSENPNTNYGGEGDLYIWYNFGGTQDIRRTFLQFDISSIPNNSTIRSAVLSVSGRGTSGSGDLTLAVKEAKDWWGEYQIDWDNQPRLDSYVHDTAIPTQGSTASWMHFNNLNGLVQSWADGANNGLGIVFNQESGRKYSWVHGSDYQSSNFRYKLTIVYEH